MFVSIMGSILSALIPAGFKLCFHFKNMHLDMRKALFILKKGRVGSRKKTPLQVS